MSRTRTTRTTAAATSDPPAEQDRIQELLTALNGIDGIEFAEDAWEEKAPNNYGVVELTGEAVNDYADGRKTAQGFAVAITIYVSGGSHKWVTAVQSVLDRLHLGYTMPQREYLHDIGKVKWMWNTKVRMPVIYTPEAVPNG